FQLDGIPPAPRGIPQIEVAFDIDANGILSVSAKDKGTNREQHIKIQASSGLTKEEIDRMKTDAKANVEEDKARREAVETRNRADQQIWQTEKQIEELGDKIDAESKAKLQAGSERIKETLKGTDIQAIKSACDDLDGIWQEASTKMYENVQQEQQQEQAAGGAQEEPAQDDEEKKKDDKEVEDADYEVVEE
ncbi:MAG: Hsp70 family protein, partial [Calditrichaeota bacterium]|nr:Hsp70 family protein [Calditrichota bacterium]